MTPPNERDAARAEGDRRCDGGMALDAGYHALLILRGQLYLLDAIRAAPDRVASIDATSDLIRVHPDGGRWRGSILRGLSDLGLIREAGPVSFVRSSRSGEQGTAWRGIDDNRIDAHRDELRCLLAEVPPSAVAPGQPTLFG
jgi:hypothetical protein